MGADDWLGELDGSLPAAADAVATLDATTLDRLAGALDVDRVELAMTVRALLRAHGMAPGGYEIRTDTWRVDLPAGVVRSVLTGAVGVAVLQSLGSESLPLADLGALAAVLLEIGRVEVQPTGGVVHARLHHPAGEDPVPMAELLGRLPAQLRPVLSAADVADVVERLRRASQAKVGAGGLQLWPPGARQGFRFLLSESPALPLSEPFASPLTELPVAAEARSGSATTATDPGDQPSPAIRAPRVFVSYAHDSAEHKEQVRELCYLLRQCGIDVHMDQWDVGERRDWQVWATHQIRDADFVLVIASPMCRRVGDGEVDPYTHRGLQSELRTLRELYHSEPAAWQRRCLPVVLPGGAVGDIPLFLQPRTADHFVVTSLDLSGVEALLRLLTGQPADRRPAAGPVPMLPPRPAPGEGRPGSG